LVEYQLHVGRIYARDGAGADRRVGRIATVLDAAQRVQYLATLGVNAIQSLPLAEFETPHSMGYNGTDILQDQREFPPPG
jgi:1,4-alpha-glucan branching enzyme